MGNPRCNWVRDRLPLLAGDELGMADRRRVERHLIGCPKCREHRLALSNALEVLHLASESLPGGAEGASASLWPAVARQIRESRRAEAAPLLSWPRFGLRPAFAMGLGLCCCVAIGVVVAARLRTSPAPSAAALSARPSVPVVEAPAPVAAAEPAVAEVEPPPPPADTPVPETVPATRLGFDLDHGTPMGSDPREGKQPTY